jgi:hypothetical protein
MYYYAQTRLNGFFEELTNKTEGLVALRDLCARDVFYLPSDC